MNKKIMYSSLAFVFAFALVSAGLVSYLSNEVGVDVTVMSPVLLEISGDNIGWIGASDDTGIATIELGDIYGLTPVTFWVRDTNLADVYVPGSSLKLVTNEDGVTCNDFESVMASGTNLLTLPNGCVQGLLGNGTEDPNTVDFSEYSADGLNASQATTTEITMTFKENALGTYAFTMRKMADTE